MDGGAQEAHMRAGTENVASVVGMAVALQKNCQRVAEAAERMNQLESKFIGCLRQSKIDFIRNGADTHIPGNISISIRDASGEMLLHRLDLKKIAI